MSQTTVGVLALQGDIPEHLAALRACGVATRRVRQVADLAGLNALVLPGGESTTVARLLVQWGLLAAVQDQIRAGLPVYGSCAGMILLADRIVGGVADQVRLGGLDVTVRRNAFGRQVDSFEGEVHAPELTAGGAKPLRGVFIRAPWVEDCGDSVQVLAAVSTGPAAGKIVAVRQNALMATAFHPELSGDLRVHRAFVDLVASRRFTAQ